MIQRRRDTPRGRLTTCSSLCFLLFLSMVQLAPGFIYQPASLFHCTTSAAFPSRTFQRICSTKNDNANDDARDWYYDDDENFDAYDKNEQYETYAINLQIAKLAQASSMRNKTAAGMAYDLLRKQRSPDTVAYNSVLKALAKTSSLHHKNAAVLAATLLEEMEDLHEVQAKENKEWYDRLNAENLTEEELSVGPPRIRVKPNVRTYSTVIDAWGKQSNPLAAQQAQDLLERLQEKYEESGDVAMQPNAITYNTVINGWAKSGALVEGTEKCEALLKEMETPDVISFNAVLHAWARSGLPNAGEQAEHLLREMTKGDRPVQPNGRTYTTVMDAWSRSHLGCTDSARRAHTLLKEMEELSAGDPDSPVKPNYVSYSTVINAYALSKTEPLKAHKAFSLLNRMNRLTKGGYTDVRPNRVTYNSVLNACATSCPTAVENLMKEKNLNHKLPTLPDMVRTLYNQLLDEEHNNRLMPDHFTFGTVLKAVANLFWGEPDQVEFGKMVFEEACARGQVSFGVLWQLRQAMPIDIYRELLPPQALQQEKTLMNHIPKDWKYNVREESRRYKPSNKQVYSR